MKSMEEAGRRGRRKIQTIEEEGMVFVHFSCSDDWICFSQ